MDATSVPGAVCATHPGEPIAFTCTRCGAFACELCRGLGDRCPSCVRREGVGSLSAGAVLTDGFQVLARGWRRLAAISLVQLVPGGAVGVWSALVYEPRMRDLGQELGRNPGGEGLLSFYLGLLAPLLAVMVVTLLAASIALAGYVQVLGDLVQGTERPLEEQLRAAARAYPATLVIYVARALVTMLGMCLCCVPGMALYVMLALSLPAIGLGAAGFGAMKTSWRLVQQRAWLVAGTEAVAFALIFGGATAVAGVTAGLKLIGPSGQIAGALIAIVVNTALALPLYAIEVVLFVRLRAAQAAAQLP